MAYPYTYTTSGINKMIAQLRNSFPSPITVNKIKQLGIDSGNERSVISALRFIGIIDENGEAIEDKKALFVIQDDKEFAEAFSKLIKDAYKELFDLHNDVAWTLSNSDLVQFFRTADDTGGVTGGRQARLFRVFSALSGKADPPASRNREKTSPNKKASNKATPATNKPASTNSEIANQAPKQNSVLGHLGMSIKIEVNLPSDASAEAYDNIFKSIRKHLIDG